MKRQSGFTLVELLAVMAIIGILAGVVAGSVSGLGGQGINAQIASDTSAIETATDRFLNATFPESLPVAALPTGEDELGVREIDFDAALPQDPTKTFVPDFMKKIPNSAALMSYRIDVERGRIFTADNGAAFAPPPDSRLDSSFTDTRPSGNPEVTFTLKMGKNRAAVEELRIQGPAGFVLGGRSLAAGSKVGKLKITFGADNPWKSGQKINLDVDIVTTGEAHKWEMKSDYTKATSGGSGVTGVKGGAGTLIHKLNMLAGGSIDEPWKMFLEMDRTGLTKAHNEATETWVLTIFDIAQDSTGVEIAGERLLTNPSVSAVYRWLTEEHSTIQVEDIFVPVAGKLAVVIKDGPLPPVLDDSPPAVTAPSNITVESEGLAGTPKTNTAIATFLASASAADDVDPSPTLVNNAPSVFPLGPTTVIFTATDAAFNEGTAQATVTVFDDTAPEVQGILVNPNPVDVTSGPADITVTGSFTDNASGIDQWLVQLVNPSGSHTVEVTGSPGRTSGTNLDGDFEGTVTMPQLSEAGSWLVSSISVTDLAGNEFLDTSPVGLGDVQVVAGLLESNLGTPVTLALVGGSIDDGSALVSLPFDFPFFGTANTYNQVYVNANGNLTFGAASSAIPTIVNNLIDPDEFLTGFRAADGINVGPAISPMWDDMMPEVGRGSRDVALGEVDFYTFNGAKGDVVSVEIDANRSGSPLDSILTLLDSHGHVLAVNNDFTGFVLDSKIDGFVLSAMGTYFLKISENGAGPITPTL